MKVIILMIVSLILHCSTAYKKTKLLDIDIRHRSCLRGAGIGSTVSTRLRQNNTKMKNFNIIKLTPKSIVIEIELSKKISDEQKVFFGKEYSKSINQEELFFIQEQDFILDSSTLFSLQLDPEYRRLKRGAYPLQIVNDKALFVVELSAY